MSEKLLPCPFCGGVEFDWHSGNDEWWIECCDCHAEGPVVETVEEAGDAWNRRTGITIAERAVVEAAMDLTKTAHEMGVVDPVSHIAVAVDLRKYASKEHAVFNACAALAKARGEA